MNNSHSSRQSPTSDAMQSCPRHWCFEKSISHQLGLNMPMMPKPRHLKTKHRQHQRTTLAIISCFLNFSLQNTPAFTLNSTAAATFTKWQLTPATWVTLVLPGGWYHRDQESLKSNTSQPATQYGTTHPSDTEGSEPFTMPERHQPHFANGANRFIITNRRTMWAYYNSHETPLSSMHSAPNNKQTVRLVMTD